MSTFLNKENPSQEGRVLADYAISALKFAYYSLRIADFFDFFD